jgi:general secretion pathway protein E
LNQLNDATQKILIVEDPVEYQLTGINQIQDKPQIDLTFARALRSIVRQDPDIIMIGEMRDQETARIAVQSALTGHLVLSTLHTNNAASSITRMLDMGVEDYLVTTAVYGVLAQRLLRKLCQHCRQSYEALPELVETTGLGKLTTDEPVILYKAAGCEHCRGTGYQGRTAIMEMLSLSDAIRKLILSHADAATIAEQARSEGMQTLYEDGLTKALAGITSIEEVLRVTQES